MRIRSCCSLYRGFQNVASRPLAASRWRSFPGGREGVAQLVQIKCENSHLALPDLPSLTHYGVFVTGYWASEIKLSVAHSQNRAVCCCFFNCLAHLSTVGCWCVRICERRRWKVTELTFFFHLWSLRLYFGKVPASPGALMQFILSRRVMKW